MRIIKDQKIVENEWQHCADSSELPLGKVTVTIAHWLQDKTALIARGDIGLYLTAGDKLDCIKDDLNHFGCIALEFETFTDGRGFSQAHLLRERYGFTGEIRATGAVIRDQIYYLHRCGINAIELAEEKNLEDALKAYAEFTVTAQPDIIQHKVAAGPWR